MPRTSVYGFDRAQVDGYERLRTQVAFLAQQLGFSLVDIEKLEAHEQNFQIVQITNAVASSDGTYTGQIVIDKGGSFEATQDCRVRAVSGTLSVGKTYLARQSGYDGASAVFTVFDSTSQWTTTDVKTADYTAKAYEVVRVNPSSNFTIYMPSSPTIGDPVRVVFTEDPAAHIINLDGNGANMQGSAFPLGLVAANTYYSGHEIQYVGGTTGWAPIPLIT